MEIKLPIPALLCAAALTLGAPASAPAQEKKATAAATPEASGSPIATAKAIPYHGKIASVNLSAKTFMIGRRTIRVTDQTQTHKEGAAAMMPDVAPGEKVSGSCWKKDNGTLEAKSMNLGAKMEASGSTRTAQKQEGKGFAELLVR